jgi:uncharacterized protein YecE (DUF72 family)
VIRIGCSGWSYEQWRGHLYPQRGSTSRWLELYADAFDTVEINATFYRLPAVKTVEGWARRTPDDFLFAVKASRYLTHVKRLRGIAEGVKRMDACVEPLRRAGKLGPLLWQLPPHFQRDDDVLASALETLMPARHAFEFRDASWFAEDVYELLRAHGAALVVADQAHVEPSRWVDTAGWSYLRFHSGRGRDGTYAEQELRAWAELRAKRVRRGSFPRGAFRYSVFGVARARVTRARGKSHGDYTAAQSPDRWEDWYAARLTPALKP